MWGNSHGFRPAGIGLVCGCGTAPVCTFAQFIAAHVIRELFAFPTPWARQLQIPDSISRVSLNFER